ncbi:MAG: hypothetical protein ACI9RM_002911 [Ulvibacter sp.]|jgi:hypothetical protein
MYTQINFQFLSVKRIVSFLAVFLIISGTLLAQGAPQAFKYQAVLRTDGGDVIQSSPVEIKSSILPGAGGNIGLPIYQELHEVTTNKFGLVNLNAGTGDVLIGDFEQGYNEVVVDKKEYGANGFLYYRLSTQGFEGTMKKMIID